MSNTKEQQMMQEIDVLKNNLNLLKQSSAQDKD